MSRHHCLAGKNLHYSVYSKFTQYLYNFQSEKAVSSLVNYQFLNKPNNNYICRVHVWSTCLKNGYWQCAHFFYFHTSPWSIGIFKLLFAKNHL